MTRRQILLLGAAAALPLPALTATRRPLAGMTEGPFYPPPAWRRQWTDWDADLTQVNRPGGVLRARGEALGLDLRVMDTDGRVVDGVDIEIWQCDTLAAYRHPGVPQTAGAFDEGFQGYGSVRADRDGAARFITIRPVPYPGRTPHIHVKLVHASFGERISQLFVAGDAGNPRDFLWRSLAAADRPPLEMQLAPAPAGSPLRWTTRHQLVVPA